MAHKTSKLRQHAAALMAAGVMATSAAPLQAAEEPVASQQNSVSTQLGVRMAHHRADIEAIIQPLVTGEQKVDAWAMLGSAFHNARKVMAQPKDAPTQITLTAKTGGLQFNLVIPRTDRVEKDPMFFCAGLDGKIMADKDGKTLTYILKPTYAKGESSIKQVQMGGTCNDFNTVATEKLNQIAAKAGAPKQAETPPAKPVGPVSAPVGSAPPSSRVAQRRRRVIVSSRHHRAAARCTIGFSCRAAI